jgi:hypothetical protein
LIPVDKPWQVATEPRVALALAMQRQSIDILVDE